MVQLPSVLIQLDTDQHASSFDAVVALDAGAEQLLQYHGVTPANVQALVHGAIFTRGGGDLARTAIFVGGSDVAAGELVLQKIREAFCGPLRVSVMLDSNGSNTTAVAAVLAAAQHVPGPATSALVLAATGPVGQRIAQLVIGNGGSVTVVSRSRQRAESLCQRLALRAGSEARCAPLSLDEPDALDQAYARSNIVFSAGAAGVPLARLADLTRYESLKVAVDLNAVPPAGIEGVDTTDRGTERNGLVCYGALAVGRTKMKIHREAIRRLFTRSDLDLDAPQLMALGQELTATASI